MPLPTIQFAVYYGTIILADGSSHTYTAADVAALYNIADQPYKAIDLAKPEPFTNGRDYMSYVHLKPLRSERYFDAKVKYNINNETQWDNDFVTNQGKWEKPPADVDSREIY